MSAPRKYRKRPVVIEALRFDGSNGMTVLAFIGHAAVRHSVSPDGVVHSIGIETLEGTMAVSQGDFIVRGVKGEFYPVKPDIFYATYEEEPDA